MGDAIQVEPAEVVALPPDSVFAVGKVILLKSIKGACAQLKDNTCTCYGSRPRGCQEYPWYTIGGRLHYDKGCPGLLFDRDERPDPKSLRELAEYLPSRPWIQAALKVIFRTW